MPLESQRMKVYLCQHSRQIGPHGKIPEQRHKGVQKNIEKQVLSGFDAGKQHVIIKDENNYVYANINPKTVKKVNEFYNSFNI